MLDTENEFFNGKRPWSKLKDQVLTNYLRTYLNKVKNIGNPIVLVDSFAGPGKFENDGEIGSPIMMCNIASEFVGDNFKVILVNKNRRHHQILSQQLSAFIDSKKAITINGNASDLLTRLQSILTDQIVFIYLDPFGLKGTDFKILEKFLERDQKFSTEIIINLSVPTILRYSCINSFNNSGMSKRVTVMHNTISKALGGDYWKEFLLDNSRSPDERRQNVLEAYKEKLNLFLPYVGYCPIYESDEYSTMKYAIFFASRHPDAIMIMNNIMRRAFSKHMWWSKYKDTLFEDANWEENLPIEYEQQLETDILAIVKHFGEIPRRVLWLKLVEAKFMNYLEKDFNRHVSELCKRKVLDYIDIRKTKKLNEESVIFIKSNG